MALCYRSDILSFYYFYFFLIFFFTFFAMFYLDMEMYFYIITIFGIPKEEKRKKVPDIERRKKVWGASHNDCKVKTIHPVVYLCYNMTLYI